MSCVISKRYNASSDWADVRRAKYLPTGTVLELAILGLLKDQPLHGYEIRKRLGESLGFLWGVSFGSLYPALRRLEKAGAIAAIIPAPRRGHIASTGSLSGEAAVARRGLLGAAARNRKAYELTARGEELFNELLLAHQTAGSDDERSFAVRFTFARYMSPVQRFRLLEDRGIEIQRKIRSLETLDREIDIYSTALAQRQMQSLQADLEWVTNLLSKEKEMEGASA